MAAVALINDKKTGSVSWLSAYADTTTIHVGGVKIGITLKKKTTREQNRYEYSVIDNRS